MASPDPNADVRAALEMGVTAANAYDRPDLAQRLQTIMYRVDKPAVNIVAVGEFKQGKSSLINALVNVNICPVDDDIATAVPTFVRYGDDKRAYALIRSDHDAEGDGRRVQIGFDQIRNYATELGGTDPSTRVSAVEIDVPRKLLADGPQHRAAG